MRLTVYFQCDRHTTEIILKFFVFQRISSLSRPLDMLSLITLQSIDVSVNMSKTCEPFLHVQVNLKREQTGGLLSYLLSLLKFMVAMANQAMFEPANYRNIHSI